MRRRGGGGVRSFARARRRMHRRRNARVQVETNLTPRGRELVLLQIDAATSDRAASSG